MKKTMLRRIAACAVLAVFMTSALPTAVSVGAITASIGSGGNSGSVSGSISAGKGNGNSAGVTGSISPGTGNSGNSAGVTGSISPGTGNGGNSAGVTGSISPGTGNSSNSAGVTGSISPGTGNGSSSAGAAGSISLPENNNDDDIFPSSIVLNGSSCITLSEGDRETLSVTVYPYNADNRTVVWTSSNSDVVSVESTYQDSTVINAKKSGTAVITACTSNGLSTSCTVKVQTLPQSITLSQGSLYLKAGDTAALTATVYPCDAKDRTVLWSSSDTSVATVVNGKVTAKKAGTATITAMTSNGKTAVCKVTVKKDKVLPKGVFLTYSTLKMSVNDVRTLSATINPSDADDKTLVWTSSDTSVATVVNGKVTAKKIGKAVITVTTSNGKTAKCNVTVEKAEILPDYVSTYQKKVNMAKGSSMGAPYTVYPSDATDKSVTITSSSSTVVKVGKNQRLEAVGVGTAVITITTVNGKSDTCTVTVKPAEINIKMPISYTAYIGESLDLKDITKLVTSDKSISLNDITYTIQDVVHYENENLAASELSGSILTPTRAGRKIIMAKYGDTFDYCYITCDPQEYKELNKVKSFTVSQTSVTGEAGEQIRLTVSLTPSTVDASKVHINWYSEDPEIACIKNDGMLTLKKKGTTRIKVSLDKAKYSPIYCIVTVNESEKTYDGAVSDVYALLYEADKTGYIRKGEKIKLDYYLSSADADRSKVKVKWRLGENSTGVILDEDGTITGIEGGSATVWLDTVSYTGNADPTYCRISVKLSRQEVFAKQKAFAEEMLYYCNLERAKAGVKPLKLMDDLSYLSQIRAEEQAGCYKIDHTRPDGSPWTTVFEYASIKHYASGENVALNCGTAESCVKAFMASKGHRENILRPEFTHLGVGVVFADNACTKGSICNQIFIESPEK